MTRSQTIGKRTPSVTTASRIVTNSRVGAGHRLSAGPLARGAEFVLWEVRSTNGLQTRGKQTRSVTNSSLTVTSARRTGALRPYLFTERGQPVAEPRVGRGRPAGGVPRASTTAGSMP